MLSLQNLAQIGQLDEHVTDKEHLQNYWNSSRVSEIVTSTFALSSSVPKWRVREKQPPALQR